MKRRLAYGSPPWPYRLLSIRRWAQYGCRPTLVYLVNTDGSNLRQLTPNQSGSHRWLRWSPDSNWIAFERPTSTGNTRIGLVQVQGMSGSPIVPISLPPFQPAPVMAAASSGAVTDGFRLYSEDACPQQLHFSLPSDPAIKAQWVAWPITVDEAQTMLSPQAGIPFYRLRVQAESKAPTWVITQMGTGSQLARHWSAVQTRSGTPSTQLTFSGIAAEVAAPVTILASEHILSSPFGIRCQPPQPVTIRGNPGWLLQQEATADALLPALNTVIWQEAGAYWQISGRDVSSGGEYTGAVLLQVAQNGMQVFDAHTARWQVLQ